MTATLYGRIIGNPFNDYASATATTSVAPGDLVIEVDDVSDFDEDALLNDGVLIVGIEIDADGNVDQSSATRIPYVTFDEDALTVTLAAGSPVSIDVGDTVYVLDPVADGPLVDVTAYVEVEGADKDGDPLPCLVNPDLVQISADQGLDLEGQPVALEEDSDGQLVAYGLSGSAQAATAGGGVKAENESFAVTTYGTQTLVLAYRPILHSEHVYLNGVYQPAPTWSRDGWTITVPDPEGLLTPGEDVFDVEYLRLDSTTAPTPPSYDDADETNLLGAWDLDETSGTVAHARLGDDGTYVNTPTLGQPGLVADGGTAVTVNGGSSEDILIPTTDLTPTDPEVVWLRFWFRYIGENSFSAGLFCDDTGSVGIGYWINIHPTNPDVVINGEHHTVTAITSASLKDGAEHMVWLVTDHGEISLFIDGALVDSWTYGGVGLVRFLLDAVSPLHFGKYGTTPQYVTATYDRIAIGQNTAAEVAPVAAALWAFRSV